MANNEIEHPDPDDMFHDTRMSIGDHLEELRSHLIKALLGFVLGMVISLLFLGQYVMHIIVSPVEQQLGYFEERMLAKEMKESRKRMESMSLKMRPIPFIIEMSMNDLEAGQKNEATSTPVLQGMMRGVENLVDDLDMLEAFDQDVRKTHGNYKLVRIKISDPLLFSEEIQRMASKVRKPRLTTMNITEAFMVYFKVSILTGFIVSSPWVFYQIWAFIAAGLYPQEKKLVHVYLPFSLFLFLSGVLVCQFLVMPKAIEAMLWFNEWLGLSADLRLNEWLSFALMMPVVFGVSFQTPLVMMFLHKIGILSVKAFRDYRRISWFVMAIFAAVITPSVDALSMLFLWVPMGALYELGILLCVYQGEQESLAEWEEEEKKTGELVEV